MPYDNVLVHVGDFGPYHKRIFFLVMMMTVYSAFPAMITVFLFLDIPHRCAVPGLGNDTFHIQDEAHHRLVNLSIPYDNTTGFYSQCYKYSSASSDGGNGTSPCRRWVFDPVFAPTSMVFDLDLVCDRRAYKAHFTLIVFLGMLSSTLISGPIADTLGRKPPMLIFILIQSVAMVVLAVITNLAAMVFLVFIIALSGYGTTMNTNTLLMEMTSSKKRDLAGLASRLSWALGLCAIVPYYYYMPDWRWALLVTAFVGLSIQTYWCILPESPRWLLANNRQERARKVFIKIATVNKSVLPKNVELSPVVVESKEEYRTNGKGFLLQQLKQLLTTKVLLLRISILSFTWFSLYMIYAGTTFSISELIEGSVYTNFLTQAMMEFVGSFIAFFLLKCMGRRPLCSAFLAITGISYLLIGLFINLGIVPRWTMTILYAIGRFGNTGAFAVIFMQMNEVMPTVVRNSAMGMCIFSGVIGALISPYLTILHTALNIPNSFGRTLPMFVFGATATIATMLMLLLPETRNRKLPETIEDANNIMKRKSFSIRTSESGIDLGSHAWT